MRRYLTSADTIVNPPGGVVKTDVLIAGGGLAGLYTALQLDPALDCLVLTKEGIETSNSWLAQGGIAAVIDTEHDDPALHIEDTLTAGAGFNDPEAVDVLVKEGPSDIATLQAMHVPFDIDEDGDLSITREGGHTRDRIVHAGGDATGRETVKVLASIVQSCPNIDFFPRSFLVDILTDEQGAVCGALVFNGAFIRVETPVVVLCTGGCGQIYFNTTNPTVATADGLAAALRAGASATGMEFVQFHPTALYTPQHTGPRFLISEAVRGEGGLLYDTDGRRFMPALHPLAELAPRDIVARAIWQAMLDTGTPHVNLDITACDRAFLARRFPTITAHCDKLGLDISQSPIPVAPVQHYMVGGLKTDLFARTEVPGLYACGEVSSTGVHGANRLASNSMLECLVFGRRAAQHISGQPHQRRPVQRNATATDIDAPLPDAAAMADAIRTIMERDAGIVRCRDGLQRGLSDMSQLLNRLDALALPDRPAWECYNMAVAAQQVLQAALDRKDSIGGHYRID